MLKQTGYVAEGKSRIELRGLAIVSNGHQHSDQDAPAYEAKGDYVCYRECDYDEHEDV
jgi:hypothetical protein